MENIDKKLVHSVAFRVSEEEWIILNEYIARHKTSIPKLSKETLFEKVGIKTKKSNKRSYGQLINRKKINNIQKKSGPLS